MRLLRTRWRLVTIAVLVALQVFVVLAVIAREERFVRVGTEIVLETRPVDPRDLLRGDYVILRYKIENVGDYRLLSPGYSTPSGHIGRPPGGSTLLYVELRQRGQYWEPVSVWNSLPSRLDPPEGTVYLRARVVGGGGVLRVEYFDLGRFYIPEGTGDPPSVPDAIVVVNSDGSARVKALEIDDERWP